MLQADKGPLFLFDNLVLPIWIGDLKDTASTGKGNGTEGVAGTLSTYDLRERSNGLFGLFQLLL